MNIILNGHPYQTNAITFADLVAEQNISQKRFAIEADGNLIPKTQFDTSQLTEGMQIEIVIAVGGG